MFEFHSIEYNSRIGIVKMIPFKFGTGVFHDTQIHRDIDKGKKTTKEPTLDVICKWQCLCI